MAKITKSTFKSFLRKNPTFMLQVGSRFDGMTDCVQQVKDSFSRPRKADYPCDNNLGFAGMWLVGGGRDYFYEFNEGGLRGIRVSNCCGSFTVAVKG